MSLSLVAVRPVVAVFLAVAAASAATAAAALTPAVLALVRRTAGLLLALFQIFVFFLGISLVFFLFDDWLELRRRRGAQAGADHPHFGASRFTFRNRHHGDAVALLHLGPIAALGAPQVHCCLGRRVERDRRAFAFGRFVFDQAKSGQAGTGGRADQAGAVAVRAGTSGGLEHAGAQPLAAHLHQAEAGDTADLDTGAVVLQRLLHRLFDLPDVRSVLHVDEVDYDEAGHVAQPKLTRDLARCLEVGAERGRLDAVLLRGAPRVDVDRNQRFGRVDDEV